MTSEVTTHPTSTLQCPATFPAAPVGSALGEGHHDVDGASGKKAMALLMWVPLGILME